MIAITTEICWNSTATYQIQAITSDMLADFVSRQDQLAAMPVSEVSPAAGAYVDEGHRAGR
jgi:hypothetical protein